MTAQIRIPLYSGGTNKSRVRQAKNAMQRSVYETQDISNAVEQTIAQVWAQLDAAKLSREQAITQVRSASVAFEGVKLEQQVGTRNTLDVLNAEQELLNAKLAVVDAQRTVDVTTYQLLTVLGAFDADSLQLPVNSYDPKANFDRIRYDGLKRAGDNYIPEGVRKIGKQFQKVPGELSDIAKSTGVVGVTKSLAGDMGTFAHGAGRLAKTSIDSVTHQTPTISNSEGNTAPKGFRYVPSPAPQTQNTYQPIGNNAAPVIIDNPVLRSYEGGE